jgi:hypothetical protein
MVGKLLSVTGEAVYTATETVSLLVLRKKEIAEARKRLEASGYVIDQPRHYQEHQVMMLTIQNSEFDSNVSSSQVM